MSWQPPRYEEIKMDAEIGSYQPDDDSPYFARSAAPYSAAEPPAPAAEPSREA